MIILIDSVITIIKDYPQIFRCLKQAYSGTTLCKTHPERGGLCRKTHLNTYYGGEELILVWDYFCWTPSCLTVAGADHVLHEEILISSMLVSVSSRDFSSMFYRSNIIMHIKKYFTFPTRFASYTLLTWIFYLSCHMLQLLIWKIFYFNQAKSNGRRSQKSCRPG